ncbi:hypothetical protein KAU11_03985 [Candidatus Babeliales bacterium]|nr:hypothetical protein [Candidatus Babeliales bacterium]
MNKEITRHEVQQIGLMKKTINLYKQGEISLISLINGLDSLADNLQHVDESWKDDFFDEWMRLEIVYSTCADEERDTLNHSEQVVVDEAIKKIELLIAELLHSIPDQRILTLMQKKFNGSKENNLNLIQLIQELEHLLDKLKLVDSEWREEFSAGLEVLTEIDSGQASAKADIKEQKTKEILAYLEKLISTMLIAA